MGSFLDSEPIIFDSFQNGFLMFFMVLGIDRWLWLTEIGCLKYDEG
jgi:hypothetical protein